jgi:hypothetical protein
MSRPGSGSRRSLPISSFTSPTPLRTDPFFCSTQPSAWVDRSFEAPPIRSLMSPLIFWNLPLIWSLFTVASSAGKHGDAPRARHV